MPTRESFVLPKYQKPVVEEVQLVQAGDDGPSPYSDPAALRASAGWLNEPDAQTEHGSHRAGGLGTIGIAVAALLLMTLVFVGAKLLMH
jgi:hypothetical protein